MNPERVKRISHSFDERIANEPKVSLRDGHYVVFDGQHVVAAGVDPKTVQYLAGHENSKVTMDIYAKAK